MNGDQLMSCIPLFHFRSRSSEQQRNRTMPPKRKNKGSRKRRPFKRQRGSGVVSVRPVPPVKPFRLDSARPVTIEWSSELENNSPGRLTISKSNILGHVSQSLTMFQEGFGPVFPTTPEQVSQWYIYQGMAIDSLTVVIETNASKGGKCEVTLEGLRSTDKTKELHCFTGTPQKFTFHRSHPRYGESELFKPWSLKSGGDQPVINLQAVNCRLLLRVHGAFTPYPNNVATGNIQVPLTDDTNNRPTKVDLKAILRPLDLILGVPGASDITLYLARQLFGDQYFGVPDVVPNGHVYLRDPSLSIDELPDITDLVQELDS